LITFKTDRLPYAAGSLCRRQHVLADRSDLGGALAGPAAGVGAHAASSAAIDGALFLGGLIVMASRGKALLPVLLVILLMIGVEIAAGVLKPFSRQRGKR
jgi:hypothetical protein